MKGTSRRDLRVGGLSQGDVEFGKGKSAPKS